MASVYMFKAQKSIIYFLSVVVCFRENFEKTPTFYFQNDWSGFPARRGLSWQDKKERKERDFCQPLMHFLSRMPWRTVSTGRAYSTLNKMGFKNQLVSATNVVSGYMKEHIMITGWQRSLSFLSFFSWHERPQLLSRKLSSGPVLIVCKCP